MTSPAAPEIFRLDAVELAQRLRARELSCADLMEATLNRIDALKLTFNAIVAQRSREECLAEARGKDSGPANGALFGLPLAVKDLAAVKGIPMTMGSPLLKRFVPNEDSIFVERLRAAGAIIIGKTNTPELGLGSQTFNPVYGATRNAYDPASPLAARAAARRSRSRWECSRSPTAPITAVACATPRDGTVSMDCAPRSGGFRAMGARPGYHRWLSTDRWRATLRTSLCFSP
jgi:hypothetical protein